MTYLRPSEMTEQQRLELRCAIIGHRLEWISGNDPVLMTFDERTGAKISESFGKVCRTCGELVCFDAPL